MSALTAFFVGQAMAGPDDSGELAALSEARGTREVLKVAIDKLNESKKYGVDWRQYASRLRINLDARKLSEATLLLELKKANIEHPLATEEAYAALFNKNLEDQYAKATDNAAEEAAHIKNIDGECEKSATVGRSAVG